MLPRELALRLASSAFSLKQNHPAALAEFLAVLADRQEHIVDQLVSSPPEMLSHFQGRAQEARDLLKELAQALKDGEQQQQEKLRHGTAPR